MRDFFDPAVKSALAAAADTAAQAHIAAQTAMFEETDARDTLVAATRTREAAQRAYEVADRELRALIYGAEIGEAVDEDEEDFS